MSAVTAAPCSACLHNAVPCPPPFLGHRYALSQTTLEQIFNRFASQQDEEKGAVRGMRTVA